VKLITDREITINGVDYAAGEIEVDDGTANQLLKKEFERNPNGPNIRKAEMPRVLHYETKIITPEAPQVSADATPFRDVPVYNEESPAMATEGDRVLPGTNLQEAGAPNRRGRRARSGSHSGK
jgi:hypothetical protein